MKSSAWLIRLIGLALFVLVLTRIDLGHSLVLLKRAAPATLAGAALLIFPMMAVKTVRWQWLQRSAGLKETPFGRSYLAYFTGMFAGLVTPGRVGELVRVRYLTGQGAALGPALSSVVWDRIFDVAGLLLVGVVALWPLADEFRALYLATLAGLGLLVVAAFLLVVRSRNRVSVAGPISEKMKESPSRMTSVPGWSVVVRVRDLAPDLLRSVSRLDLATLTGVVLLTLAGWVVYYLQAWLLARTLGIGLGLLPLIVAITAAAVAAFLPVSISGLGTRDAALVVLFQRFGRPPEEAVALSTLIFLILAVNAVLGFVASQILSLRFREVGIKS